MDIPFASVRAAAWLALAPAALGAQSGATSLPRTHAPRPTAAAITTADLMSRLYIFADDSMQGREAGTIGNVRGTDYIAREAKRIGLVPAGDSGTYFQVVPLRTRSTDSASTLTVAGAPLAFGTEWAARASGPLSRADVPVVFGGTLGDSAAIDSEATVGKLVVYRMPTGPAARGAFRRARSVAPEAAAVALIESPQAVGAAMRPTTFLDDPDATPTTPQRPLLHVSPAGAARMFDAPLEQLAAGAAGRSASLDLKVTVQPTPYPARNVVAILPGSDARLRSEYVAIGAHNDHVGVNDRPVDHDSLRIFNRIVRPGGAEDAAARATPEQQADVNRQLAAWRAAHPRSLRADSIANGADDDGSGSVSVLEIAERMAALRPHPRRSILFVWHTAEEKGLLGSRYFTDHPTVPRDSIVAQLNMDMVGRGAGGDVTGHAKDGAVLHGGPNYLQLVGSRRLSTELGDLVETVNREGKHGFTFDYSMDANGHPMNIYCRSDHYEYARWGIPITFFTTGGHSDYHQVTDEPEYIDYEHMARVDRLVEDVAVHVANLDHRVVVDHPKPDPKGACRQ